MNITPLQQTPHRRFNPLTGEWVLVSPHRNNRPWQGATESHDSTQHVEHDPNCYLCTESTRSSGETNPKYTSTFVFENDFPALFPSGKQWDSSEHELFQAKSEKGICRVICFSPDHSLTLPLLSINQLEDVVATWIHQYRELSQLSYINHVQIFENKGEIMGCSSPHPHGQIWAQESIPDVIRKKTRCQQTYFDQHRNTLLSSYITEELIQDKRVILKNEHFVALVPFWAVWPFETLIIPLRAMPSITSMTDDEQNAFALVIHGLTTKYDNLFECSFPYSSGIHQAPTDEDKHSEWHWHMVFYPPLLRSASIKKHMVGYELLAGPQRDITPEQSADLLRKSSTKHYSLNR